MIIYIPQIFRELWLYKLRSSLAILCIAVGTFGVIILSALGVGFHDASVRNIMDVADNSFFVWQKSIFTGAANNLTLSDIVELPRIFSNILAVSPQGKESVQVSYASKLYLKQVKAVSPEYPLLYKTKLSVGSRFINQLDLDSAARVVVIGDKLEKILFGKRKAIGERILLNTVSFTVVGVITDRQRGREEELLISYRSYLQLFNDPHMYVFQVLVKPNTDPVQFEQMLRSYLARKCHFDKNDRQTLGFWWAGAFFQSMEWFLLAVQLFLGACGMMVLAIGGIGVANLMFLIVTERTYEIGLRKALGANDRQIFLQLFFEALMIICLGVGIGIITAWITITFLQQLSLPEWLGTPALSWMTVGITAVVLALTGLLTGFFPAHRAAKMEPIAALNW